MTVMMQAAEERGQGLSLTVSYIFITCPKLVVWQKVVYISSRFSSDQIFSISDIISCDYLNNRLQFLSPRMPCQQI